MRRVWPLVAWSILLDGCAPALREPPTVAALAGEIRSTAGEVDRLLGEALKLYEELTLESVRRASGTWLAAAAADPSRITGLHGSVRANVWLAGHEPVAADRDAAALTAVQSAQLCAQRAPGSPTCDYWPFDDDDLIQLMPHLHRLKELKSLLLHETSISDKALLHLRNVRHLTTLNLQYTQVTKEAIRGFAQSNPQTSIVFTVDGRLMRSEWMW